MTRPRLLASVSAFGLLVCVVPLGSSALAQVPEIEITVSRHTSVNVTEEDVDNIFADLTKLLQAVNNPNDVPCNFVVRRSGSFDSFSTGDATINTETEFFALQRNAGKDIKIVLSIGWCGRIAVFGGCAPIGGATMLVRAPQNSGQEGVLWLHEYLHLTGNEHREGDGNVMNATLTLGGRVNSNECSSLESVVTNIAGAMLVGDPTPVQPAELGTPLEEFLRTAFTDQFPYLEMLERASDETRAELVQIILNSQDGFIRPNAAVMVGVVGGAEEARFLIRVVQEFDNSDVATIEAAIMGLGYYLNSNPNDEEVFGFVVMLASSGRLSEVAINALTITASPQAAEALQRLSQTQGATPLGPQIEAAIREQNCIAATGGGLARYYAGDANPCG